MIGKTGQENVGQSARRESMRMQSDRHRSEGHLQQLIAAEHTDHFWCQGDVAEVDLSVVVCSKCALVMKCEI